MVNSNREILINLFNYPEMCVFGLINTQNKNIYLSYTINLPLALARIIKEIKNSNNKLKKDWDKLELVILETVTDRSNLKVRYKAYCDEYSNNGWVFYNKISNLVNYKIRHEIVTIEGKVKVQVKLLNRRYKEIVVGTFDTYEDAMKWSTVNYPDSNNIINIVYLCK